MTKGTLFLIPTYLSETNDSNFIAPLVKEVIKHTTYYLVENVRTSRRYISSLNLSIEIPSLSFHTLDKKTPPEMIPQLASPLSQGKDVGVISEAGLPGLADPGGKMVAWAHKNEVRVVPLPGASAIHSAVITSGFSGQQYTFHGYLPVQQNDRKKAIKKLEQILEQTKYTQVFMETPFRNMALLKDLLSGLNPDTYLHIASDIYGKKELIETRKIRDWKKRSIDLHKIPTVYCLGYFS